MSIRFLLPLLTFGLTAACGQGIAYHKSGGWTYLNAPGLQPTLFHDFDPAPGQFGGTCDDVPAFVLLKGDWSAGVHTITLSTGAQSMTFENYGGASGALAMLPSGTTGSPEVAANQQRLETMLAGATGPIVVKTDNGWTRSVPGSPEVGKFIAACHAWRKDHPVTG